MIFRNKGRSLIGFCLRAWAEVGGRVTRFRVIGICVFAYRVYNIFKSEGRKGLVLTLKASQVLIQQSLAGYIVEDLSPLKRRVRRDRSGFPLWIPASHRNQLRQKNKGIVRLWLSLTGLYRIIDIPPILDLSSITDPGPELADTLGEKGLSDLYAVLRRFWESVGIQHLNKRWRETEFSLFPIGKSSPQTSNLVWSTKDPFMGSQIISSTWWSIWGSARVWCSESYNKGQFLILLQDFLKGVKGGEWFIRTIWHVAFSNYRDCVPKRILDQVTPKNWSESEIPWTLGRLGFKKEPAGKVRVFAMVDIWTQWLFYPLHKLIQDVLRTLPEDATFDQVGKLEKKLKSIQKKYKGKRPKAFSFDLSSATDRLPVTIQSYILSPLLGVDQARTWASILTLREYFIPSRAGEEYNIPNDQLKLKYATGQPMGALSSWVMLALTHHVIVQWAASTAGGRHQWRFLFKDYIVLGDDIVIFDPAVASRYYYIMTELLGVKIGMAKSIVSTNSWTLEFAKKFYLDAEKANMVPVRDIIVATLSTGTLYEFKDKHDLTFQHYLKLRGMGYKARSKVTANLWNMPTRLRVYLVLHEYRERDFWSWVTMKSLNSCFVLTKDGLIKYIKYAHNRQETYLVPKLQKLRIQMMEENSWLKAHPYFMDGTSSDKDALPVWFSWAQRELAGTQLIGSSNLYPDSILSMCTLVELRGLAETLTESNSKLLDEVYRFKTLTWHTQSHSPEVNFIDFQDIYREWVLINSFFLPTAKPIVEKLLPKDSSLEEYSTREEKTTSFTSGMREIWKIIWKVGICIVTITILMGLWWTYGEYHPPIYLQSLIDVDITEIFEDEEDIYLSSPPESDESPPYMKWVITLGVILIPVVGYLSTLVWGSPVDPHLINLILPAYLGNLESSDVDNLLVVERSVRYAVKQHFTGASPQMMHGWSEPWNSLGF